MTMQARAFLVAALTALAVPLVAGGQSSADAIFREGLMMERADGRLRDAIFRYERVVAEFPKAGAVVAQALRQLALAYEKLGDPRAKLMWSRLASAPANPFSAEARTKVQAAQTTESAGPFPMLKMDPTYDVGSPDGRWVVYYRDPSEPNRVYLRDLVSGAERLLLQVDGLAGAFAWSPDSRQLAFNYTNEAQRIREIRIVQVDTGTVRSLGQHAYPMTWTRRDELFAYRPNWAGSAIGLFLVPVTGGEPRHILSDPTDACGWAVTPDGNSLVYCRSKRLVIRDILSGAERPITNGSGEDSSPIVSPDGRLVAYSSNDEGEWALYVAPLDRVPVERPLRIAVESGAGGSKAWWTADGLLAVRKSQRDQHIYRIDIDLKTGRALDSPRRLTQDAPGNRLSAIGPDASRIAYYAVEGTKAQIAVMDADGTNERPLIEQTAFLPLSWRSSDEILFRNFNADGSRNGSITAINVGTGALTEVAWLEGFYWRYVPARREILHTYPKAGGFAIGAELKAFSLTEGRDRLVARIDFLGPRLAVSRDGRWIAYSVAPTGVATEGCELALMSIDGVRERTLVPVAARSCAQAWSWSPDGRFLLLTTTQGPLVMDVATRETWPLHPDVGSQGGTWDEGNWSPDGSFVTVTRTIQRVERNAWQGVTYDAVTQLLAR